MGLKMLVGVLAGTVAPSIFPYSALVQTEPEETCVCVADPGMTEQVAFYPMECGDDVHVAIDLTEGSPPVDGRCPMVPCSISDCTFDISVKVVGDSSCRIKTYKDTTLLGGGIVSPGSEVSVEIHVVLECNDFSDISMSLGGTEVVRRTLICQPCS